MKPSLDDLYMFAQIAQAGGLIRGAKRLALPKSTVSRRVDLNIWPLLENR